MDDLLVGSVNDDEHLHNLEAVLQQFQKYGLRVELSKCVHVAVNFWFRLIYNLTS